MKRPLLASILLACGLLGPVPAAESPASKRAATDPGDAPAVANRELTITATVQAEKPNGVVLSQGGVLFGWSVHIVDGRPAFSVRNDGQLVELIANRPVSGEVQLTATLTRKKLRLLVDGKEVAAAASPGLLARQPGIGLHVGYDERDPVGGYRVPNPFTGKVLSHQVTPSK